ncbi:MAG TPA: bacterial transcriptional activator domain-containing protein [Chloroflexia bacterium]|nr:bacterial transcriptional activator domain-containing protein [Chloroflexia bacterium]
MPRTLHIRLLGDFRVVADDKLVTSLNTPRLQAFLAYLLLHRDAPQPRHRIAFLFWPDSSENQAQSNLRNLLLALRRSLADVDCYVAIERQSLQWRDDSTFDLDIDQFEALSGDTGRTQDASAGTSPFHADPAHALQQAAELYRGDLLPSCYDEWILPRREQLREVFLDVLLRLVGILEDQHDLTRAILYSQRLVRHDPLREEHYRRLMRLHFANGDRAAVLNVYKQCARILKRELDTEPDSATREIMRQARAAERNTVSGKGQASAPILRIGRALATAH